MIHVDLACGPNRHPPVVIRIKTIKQRMSAIQNCLQRHLSKTRLIMQMHITYSLSKR
jgi:hypothetical protein